MQNSTCMGLLSYAGTVCTAGVHGESGCFGTLKGDATLLVVTLRHVEVECADSAMGGPGEAHHGGQPRQGPGVAHPDAVCGQQ